MYAYQQNILSIPAKLLYEDWKLISYNNFKQLCVRGKLKRTKEGKGKGNTPWVSVKDLPLHNGIDFKAFCIEQLGPPEKMTLNHLEPLLISDSQAISFFANHRKPNGRGLSIEDQVKKTTNAMVLNAIKTVLENRTTQQKIFGTKKETIIWENISNSVNNINADRWQVDLPAHPRRLKAKFEEYLKHGYEVFLHKGEGQANAIKIKGDIADFLLANYALPIKMSIPMLMQVYRKAQVENEWPDLTEQAVHRWLNEPKQQRIWILARDGKDAWRNKYGNSIERDKSNWFPNAYWAIDGSKLDWVHFDETSSNKRGAKLKINPVVDVYSEVILGYSYSESESHIDHIKAIGMALNFAQSRPFLMTYDHQSGHKMKRMKELYSNIVARNGGTHYPHKVGQKSNPMEQIFNRLQQQCANMWWWSDKQSIKVRTSRNKINEEFIHENTHNLHKREDLERAWEITVNDWNHAEHPLFKGQSRLEVYQHQQMLHEEISLLEISSLLWISQTKEITYKRDGLTMRLGDNKFTYEVYDHNEQIDIEFRRLNVGKKFIVRYNPEYMNDYVQLYEQSSDGELSFVACAQPKRAHESIPVLMDEGAKKQWWNDFKTQEEEFSRDKKAYAELVSRTGISRESLIENQELVLKMGGTATKEQRSLAESSEYEF